jgi:cytochrome oxidase Cu insertion factor (SCO1/SenC/PrrC family)
MALLQIVGVVMVEIVSGAWMAGSKAPPVKMALLVGAAALVVLALWRTKSEAEPPKVGDKAPDFALPDQNGRTIRLSDFRGKKTVVLAFYIKAFTPG